MTENEKELRKDLEIICPSKKIGQGCIDMSCLDCIAETLSTIGYRKIPDGAVVMTKEEYERLNSYISEDGAKKIFYEECEKLKEQVRKETAREILQAVDDESYGQTSAITRVLRKRYGVEVEE